MTNTTDSIQCHAKVRWIAEDGKNHSGRVIDDWGTHIHIESNEIWDYDDDGMDEYGYPIMRPLYERYRVERERVVID